MFRHGIGEKLGWKTYFDWYSLSFLAGSVNAGGYLSCHRFVSHVTGFATLAGVDAANRQWDQAVGILSVPIYFLLGVMISAYLVEKRRNENKRPRYEIAMGLASLCLGLVLLGGVLNWFGEWGSEMNLEQDYLLLALLCCASGLQNATLTSSSGSTIRTTHLTGITTDLGIGLIRMTSMARHDHRRSLEWRANLLRLGTIVSFMLGSAIGAALFLRYAYMGFILPLSLALYATLMALLDQRQASA